MKATLRGLPTRTVLLFELQVLVDLVVRGGRNEGQV